MKNDALFINGVFQGVLDEILELQEALPDQILFLQPYSKKTMRVLKADPPSVEDPMQVLVSTTEDLGNILFAGQIVRWCDKRQLDEKARRAISRVIWTLQPGEGGLYDHARGIECVNLLLVRRLRRIQKPVRVQALSLRSKGRTIAGKRSTAGGWAYVEPIVLAT